MRKDLEWWSNDILESYNTIKKFKFDNEIFSDASLTGWGASFREASTHGLWTLSERKCHINYLELLAALFALKSFANKLSDCQILLRIDNLTAISYINKIGGIKFPHLNDITRQIWEWCNAHNIWIYAEYVASKEDPVDRES